MSAPEDGFCSIRLHVLYYDIIISCYEMLLNSISQDIQHPRTENDQLPVSIPSCQ